VLLHFKEVKGSNLGLKICYRILRNFSTPSVISGFRCDVDDICALLRYYAALNGSPLPTFRDIVSVPSKRVKKFKPFRLGLLDP
jgi:hypothetical protein